MINPAFSAFGQGSFGYAGMDWEKILGSTVPGASYAMAVMSAKKRGAGKYTDRSSWWDYVRRRDALRIWPESVDPEKIREAGKEAAEKLDTRPAWEKAHEEDDENVDKIVKHIQGKGGVIGPKSQARIKKSIAYYNMLAQAEDAMADKLGVDADDMTELQKVEYTMAVAKEYDPSLTNLPTLEDIARQPPKEQKEFRYLLRDHIQKYRSEFFSDGRKMGVIE
jgi:roadblock/LC7 domain-containing protein